MKYPKFFNFSQGKSIFVHRSSEMNYTGPLLLVPTPQNTKIYYNIKNSLKYILLQINFYKICYCTNLILVMYSRKMDFVSSAILVECIHLEFGTYSWFVIVSNWVKIGTVRIGASDISNTNWYIRRKRILLI